MDREVLIEAITREVYRQIQQQGDSGFQKQAGGVFLTGMRPDIQVEDVRQLLASARQQKRYGVCVPQWFVSMAKEELAGSQVRVATVVGLPGGTTSPLAKYAEIKQAAAGGADTVFVPANMELCRKGDFSGVRKDLAECLTAAGDKVDTAALLEVKDLSMGRLEEAAEICIGGGADVVMLSCVTGGNIKLDMVRRLKERGIRVGVYGGASQPGRQEEFRQAGAGWITAVYR